MIIHQSRPACKRKEGQKMKRIVVMMIEDEKTAHKAVEAFNHESANIYVTAPTMPEALRLLEQGIEEAQEACRDYAGTDDLAEDPAPHYVTYNQCIEEMNEAAAEFEATPAGIRFKKNLENAGKFYFKHSKGGLKVTELEYIANKNHNSLLNGSFDLCAYAFRQGYNRHKKDCRQLQSSRERA